MAIHSRQLEAAKRELDSFAARIAHDLRGPLLGMLGLTRIVRDKNVDRLEPQSLGYLQQIIAGGERTERMVSELLAFARLGEAELKREPVSLDEAVRQGRQMGGAPAQRRGGGGG